MPPIDLIFEIHRIARAQLPRIARRQAANGPRAAHDPELINLRPNGFNLEILCLLMSSTV